MGIKPKGPLFLLRETEALLCAHSQSVQQASFVWKRLPLCGKGVLCVENCIANNQRIIRRNLNKCFYQSNWIWCIHDFNHQLRIFKLKTFCFLKILLVIKYRQMYTALPVPSEKSTSHMCPIQWLFTDIISTYKITLVQVSCYFHSPEMITWQFWIILSYSS